MKPTNYYLSKKFTLLILILFIGSVCSAQNSLSGKVNDKKDNASIPGVTVYIPDLKLGAACDADGNYKIEKIPGGSYLIQVSYVGYSFSQTKEIKINGAVTVDFLSDQSSIETQEVVVTGNSRATDMQHNPQPTAEVIS